MSSLVVSQVATATGLDDRWTGIKQTFLRETLPL